MRTKQGFIILQATQRNAGGEASYKQVERRWKRLSSSSVWQPKLREYLTKLRGRSRYRYQTGSSGRRLEWERNEVVLQRLHPSCRKEAEEI